MNPAQATDWNICPLPDRRVTVALDRLFTHEQVGRLRLGLIPEEMSDKWFVYWQDDTLHFHRSWTGHCIYIVRLAPESGGHRMTSADVNRDPEQYSETDDALDARLVSWLIDVLLLHIDSPYPEDEEEGEGDEAGDGAEAVEAEEGAGTEAQEGAGAEAQEGAGTKNDAASDATAKALRAWSQIGRAALGEHPKRSDE